jgi:hypothetical protein
MAEQRDWIGQIVGEYRLLRKLGGGSFGQVYLAEHIRDNNQVALKLLQVYLTTKEDLRAFLNLILILLGGASVGVYGAATGKWFGLDPQINTTATAQAHVTTTVQARATATAGPISTATSGQPVYQDSLNNPKNPATVAANWDQDNQCTIASNGYHIVQLASRNSFLNGVYQKRCREQGNTYGNLALTVNIDLLSGHSGGIFFRLSDMLGYYYGYCIEIGSQGNYKIFYEQGRKLNELKGWTTTSFLQSGYRVNNLLQIIARGTTLTFYANNKFLTQIQDNTDTSTSTIGFFATADQGGGDAEIVYSNLKAYKLT